MAEKLETPSSAEYKFIEGMILLEGEMGKGSILESDPIKVSEALQYVYESLSEELKLQRNLAAKALSFLDQIKRALEKEPENPLHDKLGEVGRILEMLNTIVQIQSLLEANGQDKGVQKEVQDYLADMEVIGRRKS